MKLEPIRMPEEAKQKRIAATEIDGVWWPPNACWRCQKRLLPYGVGVPVEEADAFCWGHQTEEAIAKAGIDDACRKIMDLYGGNLDHPALDHLEAALAAIEAVSEATEPAPSGGGAA